MCTASLSKESKHELVCCRRRNPAGCADLDYRNSPHPGGASMDRARAGTEAGCAVLAQVEAAADFALVSFNKKRSDDHGWNTSASFEERQAAWSRRTLASALSRGIPTPGEIRQELERLVLSPRRITHSGWVPLSSTPIGADWRCREQTQFLSGDRLSFAMETFRTLLQRWRDMGGRSPITRLAPPT